MVRPGRDRLNGIVEVDGPMWAGRKAHVGPEIEGKAIVALAVEEDGKGVGRIRLRRAKDVSADSLLPFVQGAVVTGTTIHTDGWSGYAGWLQTQGERDQRQLRSRARGDAARAHGRLALKRWLLGTLQGGIQHQHLDYYLDEFTFRFNRRRSRARGLLFHRLAEQAVAVAAATTAPSREIPQIRATIGDRSAKGIPSLEDNRRQRIGC